MQFGGRGLVEHFYAALDEDVVNAVVRTALDGGVSWFDTAEMYGRGNSERLLTSALRAAGKVPGDVVIATKWAPALRAATSISRTIDTRLSALQGYPIDLHQMHMPRGSFSGIERQVREMALLSHAGKISAVGVSNFSAKQLETASRVLRAEGLTLASNQIQLSLLHRAAERDGVLETARRLGVTLIAYAPLRSGLLTGKFHDDPERVKSLRTIRRLLGDYSAKTLARTAPLIDELRAIGAAHGVAAGQVALSWLVNFYGTRWWLFRARPARTGPRRARPRWIFDSPRPSSARSMNARAAVVPERCATMGRCRMSRPRTLGPAS